MLSNFTEFIEKITERLAQPLPGEVIHAQIATNAELREQVRPNEFTRRSAVLLLMYPHKGEILVPLIRRPAYDGVHGGQVAFPGGRFEKNDKNLIRTALREAQEEIGVRLTDIKVIGKLTELYIPPSNFYVQPVLGYMHAKPDFYPDEREVADIIEVSLATLINPDILGTHPVVLRGTTVQAPAYNVHDNQVWGATAMMIAEFLEAIRSS